LEAHSPQLVESEPERAARHFSEAGFPDRAVAYWSKAADRAQAGRHDSDLCTFGGETTAARSCTLFCAA
jgi:hypothetical protein